MLTDPHRTRIKICGLTQVADALTAAEAGADSIGLVFHERSPRCVDIEQALMIRRALPAFVTVTALFMDEQPEWIDEVINQLQPDLLQFHGSESVDDCTRWQRPYIKAIPMGDAGENALDIREFATGHPAACGFLLDSHVAGRQGGSGDTFDWFRIPSDFPHPLILAGGLNPQNVARAIAEVRPWAVDVSSGVERDKGVKDAILIQQFCQEVFRADTPC